MSKKSEARGSAVSQFAVKTAHDRDWVTPTWKETAFSERKDLILWIIQKISMDRPMNFSSSSVNDCISTTQMLLRISEKQSVKLTQLFSI